VKARGGGCLCGAIRYEVRGAIGPLGNCHCVQCQKSNATAFATTARVARRDFEWIRGEASLRSFESSPGKRRFFCGTCGSQLLAAWDHESEVILRIGSLSDDPGSKPVVHIWTEEQASWYRIEDALPRLPRGISRRVPRDS
jgi:ADP-ribosyl-[dinitrogen reductase] hydrolase